MQVESTRLFSFFEVVAKLSPLDPARPCARPPLDLCKYDATLPHEAPCGVRHEKGFERSFEMW